MLNSANEQAQAAGVEDRVEFRLLDVLQSFDLGGEQFDLVNQRFAKGHLHTWDWPNIFSAFKQVLRPGGIIRLTEPNGMESNSPTLNQLDAILNLAFYQSGRQFSPARFEFVQNIERLMQESGLQNIQTQEFRLNFRQGTPEGSQFSEDMRHFYRNIETFLRKFTAVPDDYDAIYQQLLLEMQEPEFSITWPFLTVWGTRGE
jgi:SAM-dependent methyltransferase